MDFPRYWIQLKTSACFQGALIGKITVQKLVEVFGKFVQIKSPGQHVDVHQAVEVPQHFFFRNPVPLGINCP